MREIEDEGDTLIYAAKSKSIHLLNEHAVPHSTLFPCCVVSSPKQCLQGHRVENSVLRAFLYMWLVLVISMGTGGHLLFTIPGLFISGRDGLFSALFYQNTLIGLTREIRANLKGCHQTRSHSCVV